MFPKKPKLGLDFILLDSYLYAEIVKCFTILKNIKIPSFYQIYQKISLMDS